jgi:hypothetical protein
MSFQRGDIVSLRGHTGLWVVVENRPGNPPPLTQVKFARATHFDPHVPSEAITTGLAMATLITSPSLTVGQIVKYADQHAVVVSDDPDRGEVSIHFTHQPELTSSQVWNVAADRAPAPC